MSITYAQKRLILDHFSNDDAWDYKEFANKEKTRPSQLPHIICLTHQFSKALSTDGIDCLNASKIILSRDIGIQSTLRAVNKFSKWKFDTLVQYGFDALKQEKKLEIEKEHVDNLQNDWNDVTEFDGYDVATPYIFAVEMIKKGYNFQFSFSHKEQIFSHTALLHNIMASGYSSVPIQSLKQDITQESITHILQNGASMKDHRGREWAVSVIDEPKSFDVWDVFRSDTMRLDGDNVAAINYDHNRAMIAMDKQTLEQRLAL